MTKLIPALQYFCKRDKKECPEVSIHVECLLNSLCPSLNKKHLLNTEFRYILRFKVLMKTCRLILLTYSMDQSPS